MAVYEIVYTLRRRSPGKEDFSDIGFGISGIWSTPDECGHMVLSDIQNYAWETEGNMPTPEEIRQDLEGVER